MADKRHCIRIAALFVQERSAYTDLPGVEAWGEAQDARTYQGPWPVVAHPPCARWGRYWNGGPSARKKQLLGDDGGCFESALLSVHMYGGVLEHPADSLAWTWFGIEKPPRCGGWIRCKNYAWTCCVEQGHYGHMARKATWLYISGIIEPPELIWGPAMHARRLKPSYKTEKEYRRAVKTGSCQRLSKRQRACTPVPFRNLLISLARNTQALDKGRPVFLPAQSAGRWPSPAL